MSPEAYRDKIVSRLAQLGLDLRPVESISGHPGEFPRNSSKRLAAMDLPFGVRTSTVAAIVRDLFRSRCER